MRAIPPSTRISAGIRSKAITATAPASSAILACLAFVTSMITPPFSISARPTFTSYDPLLIYQFHLFYFSEEFNCCYYIFDNIIRS